MQKSMRKGLIIVHEFFLLLYLRQVFCTGNMDNRYKVIIEKGRTIKRH